MERRVTKKCDLYIQSLKNDIKEQMDKSDISKSSDYSKILQYIFDYPSITFLKDDFQKRKRAKNFICSNDRCNAKRASGEQCTRRKKEDNEYCGTHIKGLPHGEVDIMEATQKKPTSIEVFVQDINGINYYIDNKNNVYNTEEILKNSPNPSVIAKYTKNAKGEYKIPSLGLN